MSLTINWLISGAGTSPIHCTVILVGQLILGIKLSPTMMVLLKSDEHPVAPSMIWAFKLNAPQVVLTFTQIVEPMVEPDTVALPETVHVIVGLEALVVTVKQENKPGQTVEGPNRLPVGVVFN